MAVPRYFSIAAEGRMLRELTYANFVISTSASDNPRKSLLESSPRFCSGRIAKLRGVDDCSFPDRMRTSLVKAITARRMTNPTEKRKDRDRLGCGCASFGDSACSAG